MDLFTSFPPRHVTEHIPTAEAWRAHWPSMTSGGLTPFDLALRAGWQADRLAWAFGGGYQAALRALQPQRVSGADTASLCATEATGNRPRDIQSRLWCDANGHLRLTGRKRWSTMSPVATHLFVLARDASQSNGSVSDDRPVLKLIRVAAQANGVTIAPMPATAFTPELPHAELTLSDVLIAPKDVLEGDGWSDHVKPFRTLEDIFVSAACLAWLVRTALAHNWPRTVVEDSMSVLAALQVLANQPPSAPATHIALAGALRWMGQVYEAVDAHCITVPDQVASAAWMRDRKLFGISGKTRDARTERAWSRL